MSHWWGTHVWSLFNNSFQCNLRTSVQPVNLSFYCEFLCKVWCHVTCKHQCNLQTSALNAKFSLMKFTANVLIVKTFKVCANNVNFHACNVIFHANFHAKFHVNFHANFHAKLKFHPNFHAKFHVNFNANIHDHSNIHVNFHANFHSNIHVNFHANFQTWRLLPIKLATEPVISTR